jgi:hypothetical protein
MRICTTLLFSIVLLTDIQPVYADGYWKLTKNEFLPSESGTCGLKKQFPDWVGQGDGRVRMLDHSATHWHLREYNPKDTKFSVTYRYSWSAPPAILHMDELVPLTLKVEVQEARWQGNFPGLGFSAFGGSTTANTGASPRAGMVVQAKNKQDRAPSDRGIVRHPTDVWGWDIGATPQSACGLRQHVVYNWVPTATAGPATTLLTTINSGGVNRGRALSPTFKTSRAFKLTKISTYHYGTAGFVGSISLRSGNGQSVGSWAATLNNGFVTVNPNIVIPPGTYTVIDSQPQTWSYNAQSGNLGMTLVEGTPQ